MSGKTTKGLIHVYTGDGKGKTTAALGLALRAAGHGMRVGFIQFVKGRPSGEHFSAERCGFEIVQPGQGSSFAKSGDRLANEAQQALGYAEEQMMSGKYDLLVLDEVFVAIHKGLVATSQVSELLARKPDTVELVLTGRNAPSEIVQQADLVTEMRMVKHPFQKGIHARRGIEY